MFQFFFDLFLAIYNGTWYSYNRIRLNSSIETFGSFFGKLIKNFFDWFGNIFNNSTSNSFVVPSMTIGNYNLSTTEFISLHDLSPIEAYGGMVVATICCVVCFFIIVKAIKKLFTFLLDL